jgi:hypothetical protein
MKLGTIYYYVRVLTRTQRLYSALQVRTAEVLRGGVRTTYMNKSGIHGCACSYKRIYSVYVGIDIHKHN